MKNNSRLLFAGRDGGINEIDVRLGSDIQIGSPRTLFKLPVSSSSRLSVLADGQRFITLDSLATPEPTSAAELSLVINWAAELKKP